MQQKKFVTDKLTIFPLLFMVLLLGWSYRNMGELTNLGLIVSLLLAVLSFGIAFYTHFAR